MAYQLTFKGWHDGHNVQVVADNGKLYLVCYQCGVVVELPSVSKKEMFEVKKQ